MRGVTLRGTMLIACLLWALGLAHAAERIPWAGSLAGATAEANRTHKLVMVDFYTDWCTWCKKLEADTFTDKRVIRLAMQTIPVRLNAEKEGAATAKKYHIVAFPTILFLTDAGEVAGRIIGYLPPKDFAAQLQQVFQLHKELPTLLARFRADPTDLEAVAKLAILYAGQNDRENAVAMLRQVEKLDPDNAKGQLAKTCNTIGDMFQGEQEFDKAIPLFQKAVQTGKAPYEIVYAHIGIAFCRLSQKRPKDAIPELEAAVAVPNGPKDFQEQARKLLASLKASTQENEQDGE
jgi:thioredoxin-related protein